MNYLELVNGVLMRLREPEIPTVRVHEDPVANLAKTFVNDAKRYICLLYTSPSPRDKRQSRMPSSA